MNATHIKKMLIPASLLSGLVAFFILFILAADVQTSAQVMSSGNYKLQLDSANAGGGLGTSNNYRVESTVGEVGTGRSSSATYSIEAGYQTSGTYYMALVPAGDVTMTPSIGGVSGGTSNGSTDFTVTTDNPPGYQVTLSSETSPSLSSGSQTISDYVPGGAAPDFNFSTSVTAFGFSPEGSDIVSRYKDNGSSCDTGSSDTASSCWDGLSTSPTTIVSRGSGNHPSGTQTTLKFRTYVAPGSLRSGIYTGTTTITVLAL